MAGDQSFDVVSEFDVQELRNALDQVRREVAQRFDFRGATVTIDHGKDGLELLTDDEVRARGERGRGLEQEQGRAAAGHAPPPGARRDRAAPVRELPMTERPVQAPEVE